MLKNYHNAAGATAAFTMANEIGEIVTAAIVPDTKMENAAHALEQVARRPNFGPKVCYWDTFPNKEAFF